MKIWWIVLLSTALLAACTATEEQCADVPVAEGLWAADCNGWQGAPGIGSLVFSDGEFYATLGEPSVNGPPWSVVSVAADGRTTAVGTTVVALLPSPHGVGFLGVGDSLGLLTPDGAIAWSAEVQSVGLPAIREDGASFRLAGGAGVRLVDTQGDTLVDQHWSDDVGNGHYFNVSTPRATDDGYLLPGRWEERCCMGTHGRARVTALNATGEEQWTLTLDAPVASSFTDVAQMGDGYVACGSASEYQFDDSGSFGEPFCVGISADGSEKWQTQLTPAGSQSRSVKISVLAGGSNPVLLWTPGPDLTSRSATYISALDRAPPHNAARDGPLLAPFLQRVAECRRVDRWLRGAVVRRHHHLASRPPVIASGGGLAYGQWLQRPCATGALDEMVSYRRFRPLLRRRLQKRSEQRRTGHLPNRTRSL